MITDRGTNRKSIFWQKERDSNPRDRYQPTALAARRNQPDSAILLGTLGEIRTPGLTVSKTAALSTELRGLVLVTRLERATSAFAGRRSILLSYTSLGEGARFELARL